MQNRNFVVRGGAARLGLAVAALVLAAGAAPVRAQDMTVYGTASADGYDTRLGLVGATVRPGGLGWAPLASLQVYGVSYESPTSDRNTVFAVVPAIGVGYRTPVGALEAKVGYSFQSDEGVPFLEGVGGRSGVVTSAQGNYWGGPVELQGITSYAWRPEYSWNQVQGSVPVWHGTAGSGTAPALNLGAQAVFEGKLAGSGSYHTWSAGPLVKYATGHHSSVSLSAGVKKRDFEDNSTWYASLGLVRYGIGLNLR
jgi:hypothetical protein